MQLYKVFRISPETHRVFCVSPEATLVRPDQRGLAQNTILCQQNPGVWYFQHSGVECELITELGWPRRGLWHSLKKAETDASKRRPHNPARGFQRLLGRSVCIDSSRTLKQTHTTVKQSHTRVTRVRLLHERSLCGIHLCVFCLL